MRYGPAILALAAAFSLGSGCSLRKQPKTVAAAPPPPKPVAPPKPVEPLSIPQTTVELPPPQPIPPDSLPPVEPETPPPAAVTPGTTKPAGRPRQGPAPPRTEPQPPVGPVTPPAVEPSRPPIVESLPAAELKRLQDEARGRVQETKQLMGRISARRLKQQDSLVKRIDSFLTQAQDAERRGDMQQASDLAGRALVLARELRP